MVTVKLYGYTYSTCTHLVWATAKEIGVDVQFVTIDLAKGEHKDPKFIENLNPFGMVPVLEDEDGTQIFESHAISRYLVAKYAPGSTLLPDPSNVRSYGLFEQAASIEYSIFDPCGRSITLGRLIAPMFGLSTDEGEVIKAVDMLTSNMEAYERILSKQKYLAGDAFTLADLSHLPFCQIINHFYPQIFSSQPHVKAWWDDISNRESWQTTLKLAGKY
ncbi:unnamed protein product [Rhizoctonia solani]|uniref:glutathione transferase n=1 Tax=Rhizoctonia solani TaxID=456999 RepID=A0A8H3BRK1_9AGAM|nr:unnamed protein product [Rhizoctonia solani]